MFNSIKIIRSSSSVRSLTVNLVRGTVHVEFLNGYDYCYQNVSRRAILNLLLNENMSLGFWVNKNLVLSDRVQNARYVQADKLRQIYGAPSF